MVTTLAFLGACLPAFEDPDDVDWDGDHRAEAFDCDDDRADVHVGAPEWCDGVDNDCDGSKACDASLAGAVLSFDDLGAAGTALAVGDFDGDGASDLAVGAPDADVNNPVDTDSGEVFLVHGPAWFTSPPFEGVGTAARTGAVLAAAGDLDGDGDDELWVGAPGYRDGDGRIYEIPGSAGWSVAPSAGEILDGYPSDDLGGAVATGVLADDGASVLVASAPGAASGAGEIRCFLDGLAQPAATLRGGGADRLGAEVATVDLDGDGLDDVLGVTGKAGTVAWFASPPIDGISTADADATWEAGVSDPDWVSALGDADGDGLGDAAVSEDSGWSWVIGGQAGGPGSGPLDEVSVAGIAGPIGSRAWPAGDTDADGLADGVVADAEEDRDVALSTGIVTLANAGTAWVALGPFAGRTEVFGALFEIRGVDAWDALGSAAATAGDPWFALGAPGHAGGAGAVYIVGGTRSSP